MSNADAHSVPRCHAMFTRPTLAASDALMRASRLESLNLKGIVGLLLVLTGKAAAAFDHFGRWAAACRPLASNYHVWYRPSLMVARPSRHRSRDARSWGPG